MKKTPKTLLLQKIEVIETLDCVSFSSILFKKMDNVRLVFFKYKTEANLTIKEILL